MPSWDIFEQQPQSYRDSVLPPAVTARVAIEAAVPQGWHNYVGPAGDVVGMTRFGASAPGPVNFEKFGFTPQNVAARALAVLGR
jgi:transketolase